MKALPSEVEPYKQTRIFDENSVPPARHVGPTGGCTGTGHVAIRRPRPELRPNALRVIPPEIPHRVVTEGPVQFRIEFLRTP